MYIWNSLYNTICDPILKDIKSHQYLLLKQHVISGPLQVGHVQRLMDINIVPGQFEEEPATNDTAGSEIKQERDE